MFSNALEDQTNWIVLGVHLDCWCKFSSKCLVWYPGWTFRSRTLGIAGEYVLRSIAGNPAVTMELCCMVRLGCYLGIRLYGATWLLPWTYVVWCNSAVAMELGCMMQLGCCHGITLYDATRLLPWNYIVWCNSAVAMELCCMVKLPCCHGIILYGETWMLPWNYIVWWNCCVAMELYCMVKVKLGCCHGIVLYGATELSPWKLCCMVKQSCCHGNYVVWWVSGILGECTTVPRCLLYKVFACTLFA